MKKIKIETEKATIYAITVPKTVTKFTQSGMFVWGSLPNSYKDLRISARYVDLIGLYHELTEEQCADLVPDGILEGTQKVASHREVLDAIMHTDTAKCPPNEHWLILKQKT